MEKRRNRKDLSTVKAAAWAWYEHGSRYEGKPVREFDVIKTRLQPPKPSRFKIEAMKIIKERPLQVSLSQLAPSPIHDHHHRDHSLLDAYEIERISKQLDHLKISSSKRFNRGLFNDKDLDRQSSINGTVSSSSDYNVAPTEKKKKEKKNKNFLKGLWFRNAVVCGTREDVDSSALVQSRRARRTAAEGHVPVVRLAVCGPRVAHA